MNKPIGLGFIGCGGHALESHARIAKNLSGMFRLIGGYDTNIAATSALAGIADSKGHFYLASSPESLLDQPNIDAVIIATPHKFHLELCELAVGSGKHVFCEKPLWEGPFEERGLAVIKKAEHEGLVFTSCHPRRFEPEYVWLKKEMNRLEGRYGNLVEISFRFFYHKPTTEWKKNDSLLLDHMNHEIDLVHFLIGMAPVTLARVTDGYDHYQVTGIRDDEIKIHFSGYRRLESRTYRNELELTFEKGRITSRSVLTNGMVRNVINEEDFEKSDPKIITDPFDISDRFYTDCFTGIMINFGKTIQGLEENYLTPQDLMMNTLSCNVLLERGVYSC